MQKDVNLTSKQQIFCKEYLVSNNATEAAIRAGYSGKSAKSQASRMLTNVNVRAYIDKHQAERAKKLDITADKVLQEIANVAFFDIRNIYDGSSLKEIADLDENTSRAIAGVKARVERGEDGSNVAEIVEVKSNDKLKALDMLSKHLGLYEKDNAQSNQIAVIEAKEPDF